MAGRATCASRSQLASLNACQIPLRSGLPAIRGGLYPVVCAEHTESVAIARMAATVTGFDMDISNELSSAGATKNWIRGILSSVPLPALLLCFGLFQLAGPTHDIGHGIVALVAGILIDRTGSGDKRILHRPYLVKR